MLSNDFHAAADECGWRAYPRLSPGPFRLWVSVWRQGFNDEADALEAIINAEENLRLTNILKR